jgi:hypothetical protein
MSNLPRVVVDALPPVFASHFLLTVHDECLFIESSAGLPAGEAGKSVELPVHCRLAVPWSAAQRLASVLNSALTQHARNGTGIDLSVPASAAQQASKLPRLEV